MRVMTLAAVQLPSGLAQVKGQEILIIAVVAVETYAGDRSAEQRNLFAAVGKVAIQAFALGRRSVCVPGVHSLLQIIVTQVAQPARSLDQESAQLAGVRHVAPRAVTADEGGMRTAGAADAQIDIMALGT